MGDMAVSNSIGSNIFDVLLGLGFPWVLRTLIVSYGSVVTPAVLCTSVSVLLLICKLAQLQYYHEMCLTRQKKVARHLKKTFVSTLHDIQGTFKTYICNWTIFIELLNYYFIVNYHFF